MVQSRSLLAQPEKAFSDEFYVASIVKYRSIIALMQDFFALMWENNKKDTKFPHEQLRLLLEETGFIGEC